MLKKNIWASFQRIIELFTQKFVTKLLKIWGWDPGSEILDLGPGVKKAPDPGSLVHNTAKYVGLPYLCLFGDIEVDNEFAAGLNQCLEAVPGNGGQ
jgi:hypothetical protein